VIATPQAAPVAAPPEAPIKPHAARQPLPLPETVLSAPKKTESAAELLPATGTFTCTLNQQVELTLPTAAHEQLDKPRVLFVALAPDKKCLWLYTKSGVEALADRLDHLGADDEAARCTQRMCYSRLHRVQPNAAGAFLLPVELVEIACLKNNVILIGVRDHFELWDAEAWEQYIGGAVDAAWPFPLGHERMEDGGLFVGSMIILQPSDPKKDGHDDSKDSGPHNESMQSGTFGTETPPHQVIDRVHGGITPGQGNLVPGQ
jgi:MraZ protein